MATRKISTKIAIDGESEYRDSLQRINAGLKTLQSSLKLTESQYQNNANSMTALKAKGDALNNLFAAQKNKVKELKAALDNAKAAEQNYAKQKAELQAKIDANNKALEALRKTTGDTSAEEARLTAENNELQKALETCDAKIIATEKGINSWQTQLNNAQIQLNNLDAEIQKNDKYLDEAAKSADGCATSIDEFGREVDDTADSVKGLGTILASDELLGFSKKALAVVSQCTGAYMDFEAQMAAVRRTTGMSTEELKVLGDHFKQLSTEIPITTEELAKIAETAGQLGIAKENVEGFAIVMAKLATTTDLTADAAAMMLAQFANITGIKTPEEYERLGSTVAALGDSTATTASRVVDMSQGIAAAANIAGLSATDTLALSAAVGSLGIEAAAGSTAMSMLIQNLYKATQQGGDKLKTFASIAGMTAQEFRIAWGKDAAGALNSFIQGLNDVERNGKNSILLLEEVGITNQRQAKAVQGLASAHGLLTETLEAGRKAWEEKKALDEKAAIMYDTLQAKTAQLDHAFNNLKIEIGASLVPAFRTLADSGTDALKVISKFIANNPELTESITLVVTTLGTLGAGIASVKLAYKTLDFLGMAKGIKTVGAAFTAAGGGTAGFVAALSTIAPVVAGVTLAIASLTAIISTVKEATEAGFLGAGHSIEEYAQNVEDCKKKVEKLEATYDSLAESGADLTDIDDQLTVAKIALGHATEEYTAAEQAEAEAMQGAADASDAYTASVEEQRAINEAVTASLAEVANSYKEAYSACRESLEGQIGLFDGYAASIAEDTDTAQEMLDLWAQQTANLGAYTENLKKAAAYGLDEGLVQSLADGSTQSAGYLATIIQEIENCSNGIGTMGSSADEAVSKFNKSFERTNEAKDNLAATMTAINEDLAGQLAEIEATAANVNFEGFWDAVDLAFANAGANFGDIAATISAEFIGGFSEGVSGIVESASSTMSETESIISSSGVSIVADATDIGAKSTKGFDSEVKKMSESAKAEMAKVNQQVKSASGEAYNSGFSVGAAISQGAAVGVRAYAAQVAEEAAQMVRNAINAANRAAQINSPSKLTRLTGRGLDEGIIYGIKDLESDVINQMQNTMIKVATVKSKVPDMSELNELMLSSINADKRNEGRLKSMVVKLINGKHSSGDVNVTQNIYAEDTSYVGQQREAKRNMKQLARELNL